MKGAVEGKLSILVIGRSYDYRAASHILRAMGRPMHLGAAGAGLAAKLANQIIVGVTIAAGRPVFAEAQGIDGNSLLNALTCGFADSTVLRVHGPHMAARDYSAAGASTFTSRIYAWPARVSIWRD